MGRVLCTALAIFVTASCASGKVQDDGGSRPDAAAAGNIDARACGEFCDQDGDGVPDTSDACPDSPPGVVNQVGCTDSQLTPMLEPTFPPYNLTWTPTGDPGRAGGLTWEYTGIERGDLFHIYWVLCDDPATPCGVSLDGPIDVPSEKWQFSAGDSDLPGGKLGFINTTEILLADGTSPLLNGRLTVRIFDASQASIPFATLTSLAVPGLDGRYGAEIPGTGFKVTAIAEVEDPTNPVWTPYLDYYDAAPTPDTGGTAETSFGGSFYDK